MYWAHVGLKNSNKKDLTTLRRVIYQCSHMLVMRGRIVHERPDGSYVFGPDLTKIAQANDGYEKMLAEEAEKPDAIRRAQRNFLREAAYNLYLHNQIPEANKWFAELLRKYPDAVQPGETLEQFALRRLAGNIRDIDQKRTVIVLNGLFEQHFQNLAQDDDERAAGLLRMAKEIYDYYQASVVRRQGIITLDTFPEMYQRVRDDLLNATNGLPKFYRDRLRTKLQLPAEAPAPAQAPPPP